MLIEAKRNGVHVNNVEGISRVSNKGNYRYLLDKSMKIGPYM